MWWKSVGELFVMSDPECIEEIREILQNMMLHDYPSDESSHQSWQQACSELSDFIIDTVTQHPSRHNSSDLITR